MDLRFQVGYTNDGLIFLKTQAQGPDGTPVNMQLMVNKVDAIRIADELRHAVERSDSPIIEVR